MRVYLCFFGVAIVKGKYRLHTHPEHDGTAILFGSVSQSLGGALCLFLAPFNANEGITWNRSLSVSARVNDNFPSSATCT